MIFNTIHPYDCFPTASALGLINLVETFTSVYNLYIFSCVHLREYAVVNKEVKRKLRKLRHSRGLGQLMSVARKRTRARALHE